MASQHRSDQRGFLARLRFGDGVEHRAVVAAETAARADFERKSGKGT
jgi:hypothetical protein